MASSPAVANDLLPLNDGLFVIDSRLCSMQLADMMHPYGDGIAAWTLSISGSDISNNYESTCRSSDVVASGDQVRFTALCSGEGDEWAEEWTVQISGKDAITMESGETLVRCDSKLSLDANLPTTVDLIEFWHDANGDCRGSTNLEVSMPGCGKRDLLDEMLAQRGWCYTQPHWSGSENIWHLCLDELRQASN